MNEIVENQDALIAGDYLCRVASCEDSDYTSKVELIVISGTKQPDGSYAEGRKIIGRLYCGEFIKDRQDGK